MGLAGGAPLTDLFAEEFSVLQPLVPAAEGGYLGHGSDLAHALPADGPGAFGEPPAPSHGVGDFGAQVGDFSQEGGVR